MRMSTRRSWLVATKRMVGDMSREGALLFFICMLDALSTYVFLHTNVAREANPLLSAAAASSHSHGVHAFGQFRFQSSSKARAALHAGTTSTSSIRFPIPPRHTPAWDFLSPFPHRLPAFLAGVAVHCRRLVSQFG